MLPAGLALLATATALWALSVAARRTATAADVASGHRADRARAGTAALHHASTALGRGVDHHLRR